MRIELRHLRAFVAVAEELHFRRAAERLNLAQPALSRTIQQLEEAVGETLLIRSNRRVELTEAGRVFLDESRRLFDGLDDAVLRAHKAAAGQVGELRIGYTDFAAAGQLPAILEGFHSDYPEIKTELFYGYTQQQLTQLKEGHIDFACLTGPILDPDIDQQVVQRDRFMAAVSQRHPLARADEIRLRDLAQEPFVLGEIRSWSFYRRQLDALCLEAGFLPRVEHEAYNSEGIFGFVAANMGVTVHLECAGNFSRKGVVMKPLTDCDTRITTVMAWLKSPTSPAKRSLIRFLDTMTTEASE